MASEAFDAAANTAGGPAAGGGEPAEARRFQVKRLTFCGDFDGANIAFARASIDADGITEVYEVHVAPDCSGESVGLRWLDASRLAPFRRLQVAARNCGAPSCHHPLLPAAQEPNTRQSTRCGTTFRWRVDAPASALASPWQT